MYRLNTTIRSKMPRLRGFELHSRWVPLMIGALAARNNLGMRLLTDFYFSRVCVVTDDASKQQRSHEVREYNR